MEHEQRNVQELKVAAGKKTRERPTEVEWHGLKYLVNKIILLGDGRYRTKVVLCHPAEKREVIGWQVIDGMELSEVEAKKESVMRALAQTHKQELFDMIRSGEYRDAQFGLYRELQHERVRIKKKWAGRAAEYDKLWDTLLAKHFEKIPILELAFFKRTKQEMDVIFNRAGHREISDKEKMCWIQMSDFYDDLVEVGIFPDNLIWEYAVRYKHSITADILKNLSARSLSRNELLAFVKACLEMDNISIATCLLLHVLLGLNKYELCGLNINSWVRKGNLSWLEVEREYYQERGKEAEMREMLLSANQYRRVVCSEAVEWILARHIRRRRAEGAGAKDAMFVEADVRMKPMSLRKEENLLLEQVMGRGMHIAIKGRGRPHNKGRDRARSDILRGTAIYNFHYVAEMTLPQIALMVGVDRVYTYAIYYVDWNNQEILQYLKQRISTWHSEVLRLVKKGDTSIAETEDRPGSRNGLLLYGKAKQGGFLELKSPYGVEGSVNEISEKDRWSKNGGEK